MGAERLLMGLAVIITDTVPDNIPIPRRCGTRAKVDILDSPLARARLWIRN